MYIHNNYAHGLWYRMEVEVIEKNDLAIQKPIYYFDCLCP